MYKCMKCGHPFEKPKNDKCPWCGAEWDGEEATRCGICGEWVHPDELASRYCCRNCSQERMTPEYVLEYVKAEGLEEDFFLECFIGKDKAALWQILEGVFKTMPKDEQEAICKDYADADEDNFAEWLEKQARKNGRDKV